MKITFVQPYYHNVWEALGVGNIVSYCIDAGIECEFFQSKFDSDQTILDAAKKTDIVAFSCTSPSFAHAQRLAKQMTCHTVVGGWHPTALMEYCEGFDQIVVGEGELAMVSIANGNRSPLVLGDPADFVWPNREVIKNERTIALCESVMGKRVASFQATKGCPFNCLFCGEKTMTNRKVRIRGIAEVLCEIATVAHDYKLDMFKFVDPTFDVSAKRVIEFCKAKINHRVNIEWECMVHASVATQEMFEWMKAANCNQVNIGCESGSPSVLKTIRKGATVEKIENAFKWAKYAGLKRRAFFLVGTPGETAADIGETKEMIARIKPDEYGVTLLCPYPGSDLYDPYDMADVDWEKTDEYSNDFWKTCLFSNAELKQFQKELTDKDNVVGRQCGLQENA